jgi:hypothetical protein
MRSERFIALVCAPILAAYGLLGCGSVILGPLSGPSYPANYATSVASCVRGVGTPTALQIPSANAPALGCQNWSTSALGYFSFQPSPVSPQYVLGQETLPAGWLGSDLTITYYASVTAGDATWEVETGCGQGSGTFVYGAPVMVAAVVSGTSGTPVNTGTFANIASNGLNGCVPGAQLHYRIFRSNFDSLRGEAYLLGITMTRRTG